MPDIRDHVKTIFGQALDLPAEQRANYLSAACDGNPALLAEVQDLLQASDRAGNFLRNDAPDLGPTIDQSPLPELPGTRIGPYKLREQIGEGGFGVVYVAEQEKPVARKVALKIIKPGMDTRDVIARFEAERQALALMDHPNIAKILDAGTTGASVEPSGRREPAETRRADASTLASGRPYFVMELVRGIPITDFCDEQKLATRERLRLFVDVCRAVQHAHQKGIIHRDLKPANVMVTMRDDKPVVKVIDFGIAKALSQRLTEKTIYTAYGQMVGTPLYMSPEQAQLNETDVDTRGDVYSLGVLLYELLTGGTPFDKETIKKAGLDELRRLIREVDPPRPSNRVSTLQAERLSTVSDQRRIDPRKLGRSLRGELDWIVMKALEKDRNRRYETASGFAADVQRYLDDEPVLACPPSVGYRLRKFARRKKTALVAVVCVGLALAGIAGGVGWAVRDRSAREQKIERDRQQRETALDQSVDLILSGTKPLIEQEKWSEAMAVVERADQLLAAAGRVDRPQRLRELRNDLAIAVRLVRIYRDPSSPGPQATGVSAKTGTPVNQHQRPSTNEEDFFWGRQGEVEFAKAFQELRIDLRALPPAEAARRIRASHIRAALIQAVGDWISLRDRARGKDDPFWKKLIAIAQQADPDPWRNRCRNALMRGDRKTLEHLIETVPIRKVPPVTLAMLGLTLNALGARDRAVRFLRRSQHEYPGDLFINDALGFMYWSEYHPPRLQETLRHYSLALAARPQRPDLHNAVGRALLWLGDPGDLDDAAVEFSKTLELNSQYMQAYMGLVHVRSRQGRNVTEISFLDPKDAQLHNQIAWALVTDPEIRWRLPESAVVLARKAVALQPTVGYIWNTLGAALYRAGDWKAAIAALNKSRSLRNGGDAFDWFFLAMAYQQLGETKRARELYARAVQWTNRHQPQDEELKRFRAEAEALLGIPVRAVKPRVPLSRNRKASVRSIEDSL